MHVGPYPVSRSAVNYQLWVYSGEREGIENKEAGLCGVRMSGNLYTLDSVLRGMRKLVLKTKDLFLKS